MAWSNSKTFRAYWADVVGNTAAFDLDADTIKAALMNNSVTPDQNATSAASALGAGTWSGNEVTDATNWVAGGRALSSLSVNSATSGVVFFDAADTSGGGAVTMSSVYGTLVYDDTLTTPVADQGICFIYFGGAQSVTAGTFTIVWNASGLWRATL